MEILAWWPSLKTKVESGCLLIENNLDGKDHVNWNALSEVKIALTIVIQIHYIVHVYPVISCDICML